MALITTLQEIKDVLPNVVSNLNNDSLLPNFDAVEQKYLLPLTGKALLDDLTTKYNSNTLSAGEEVLVKHIRLVEIAFAYLSDMAAMHVFLTDSGVRTNTTSDMQKAVGWEYKALKNYFSDKAHDGVEILLNYLFVNKATYPLWTASEEYTQFESLLIKTGNEFTKYYTLYQPSRTFFSMKSLVADAQEDYLLSAIGENLLNYFLQMDNPDSDEKKIVKLLKKALAFFSVQRACEHYPVRFNENGFTLIASTEDGETADMGRAPNALQIMLKIKMEACEREGKMAIAKAKNKCIEFRNNGISSAGFNTAFDLGPLFGKTGAITKDRKNGVHKGFRF